MAKLSPIGNNAQFINGAPASGAKLFFYAAGSSTKQTTYTDEAGAVPQTNPIILDSRGEPSQPIWLTDGISYKVVFAPSTDSDPPVSPIWDIDNVTGINDASLTIDQWINSGVTPLYVSATQFTLVGDQTSAFQVNRRVKLLVTAGTVYGYISASAYAALTTVTVVLDSGSLDSGLSSVQLGVITPNNTSLRATSAMIADSAITNQKLATDILTTQPQFDNDTSLATTAFVQRALGNFRAIRAISGVTTLTLSDIGNFLTCSTGGYTITLPAASTVGNGGSIYFQATTGDITISRAGADIITLGDGTSSSTVVLKTGDSLLLTWAGASAWAAIGGTAQIQYSTRFLASLATSGYQKLPSGIIIQWGITASIAGGGATSGTTTFPVQFPAAAAQVVFSSNAAPTAGSTPSWTDGLTATNFSIRNQNGNAATFRWCAFGY